ncbi:MAG: flagellar hook-associated protein FlgK [Lachnospiraceae bacterium]|nr:flagellar hook-associated protein FlgK [Lachnospiraceae bacterium]
MPLMGSLYVGTSGLQTSQNSLNTTAHNLSNMGTTGYVRQQVLLGNRRYNTIRTETKGVNAQQVGLGVNYSRVRQVRDYFLDQSYRRENGRSAFYGTTFEAYGEVEDLLDELNDDASFNQSLTNLWKSIEELAKTPDDTVVQRLLVQNANSFLTNAEQVHQGLHDYQNEINVHIKENVEKINELGHKIKDLNDKIREIEVQVQMNGRINPSVETANDFRDARNQCLDELSNLVNISYSEDVFGCVRVKVEGVDFVMGDTVYEMDVYTDKRSGFHTPYWPQNAKYLGEKDGQAILDIENAQVFDTTAMIASEKYTDIGKLRAMLYIRGDKVADYTDIPIKPEVPNRPNPGDADQEPWKKQEAYKDATSYEQAASMYNTLMEIYDADVLYYDHTIAQSVCMNVEAEFDQLIHNVATAVNKVLYEAYSEAHAAGYEYMVDDDGSPLELFKRKQCDAYTYDSTTGWVQNPEITDDDYRTDSLYSIPNLEINPVLIREAGKLKFRLKDGNVDYNTAYKLVEAFDADIYKLNPKVTTTCSINTYYTNLVSQVANDGSTFKNVSLSQQATVDSINYSREQIQGVSSDEELTNMIKFQNAFNASSRYINVINEMLEHIIEKLG